MCDSLRGGRSGSQAVVPRETGSESHVKFMRKAKRESRERERADRHSTVCSILELSSRWRKACENWSAVGERANTHLLLIDI